MLYFAAHFSAVCAMPNTDPVVDNRAIAEFVASKAKGEAGSPQLAQRRRRSHV